MASPRLHSGIFFFSDEAASTDLRQASNALATLAGLEQVWLRRFDKGHRWGIEFIASCNDACRTEDMAPEVDLWLKALRPWRHLIVATSVSGDVLVIKDSDTFHTTADERT